MENPEITTNEQLQVGKYYHCFEKRTAQHSINKCVQPFSSEPKYLASRIWAEDDNSQALDRWRIFGPIMPPNTGSICLCPQHGGIGFSSDCAVCTA